MRTRANGMQDAKKKGAKGANGEWEYRCLLARSNELKESNPLVPDHPRWSGDATNAAAAHPRDPRRSGAPDPASRSPRYLYVRNRGTDQDWKIALILPVGPGKLGMLTIQYRHCA